MAALVTAPGQTTTLSSSATYSSATLGVGSELAVTGSGTVVVIQGATTTNGAGIAVSDGADVQFGGTVTGSHIVEEGTDATVELGQNGATVILVGAADGQTNGTVMLDSAVTSMTLSGFAASDTIAFASPATSAVFTPTPPPGGRSFPTQYGVLQVTEADGTVAQITMAVPGADYVANTYVPANFAIVNGAVVYQAAPPVQPPTITGTMAGQAVFQDRTIAPFAQVSIADPNAGQTETATVTLSAVTGMLSDPNAATDGSSDNATTGSYTVTGTAAAVSAAIDGLVFTPNVYTLGAGGSVTTTMQILVRDTIGEAALDDTTSVVASNEQTPPAPPAVAPAPASVETSTPIITGAAAPGSTVTLLSNGVAVGSTTADRTSGAFSLTSGGPLPTGLDSLAVTSTNAGGTSASSPSVTVYALPAPVAGISTIDVSSATIGAALSQGASLAFVSGTEAVQLTDSTLSVGPDTNDATIQRLFEGLLGRSDDPSGISSYDAQLLAGVSKATVAAEFLASPEYSADHGTQTDQQFVATLYQGMLGRSAAADPASSYWTGLLAQGVSRGAVAIAVADGAEAKSHLAATTAQVWVPNAAGTLATELYATGLGRIVDPAALQNFEAAYASLTPAQLAAQIAGSAEFVADHVGQSNAAYVNSLYQDGTGRAPDPSGGSFWTGLLNSGQASRAGVLLGIATSSETGGHLVQNLSA